MKKAVLILSLLLVTSCGEIFNLPDSLSSSSSSASDIDSSDSSSNVTSSSENSSSIVSSSSSSSSSSKKEKEFKKVDRMQVIETKITINLDSSKDPYKSVNKTEFYNNYKVATSYEDAYFRTQHGLLSGEYIQEDGSLPSNKNNPHDENGTFYRLANAQFDIDSNGNRLSYTVNVLKGENYKIYSSGMYVSMNDVAAYLFAFNNIPKNYVENKNDKDGAISKYGEFARLNFSRYSGPSSSRYQYEPYLEGQKEKTLFYKEVDYGATTGSNKYVSGNNINNRGPYRFLVATHTNKDYTTPTTIENRRVYYTYNHYNDFAEYLNYYNGFGKVFGNETAGNSQNKYNSNNPPTPKVDSVLASYS